MIGDDATRWKGGKFGLGMRVLYVMRFKFFFWDAFDIRERKKNFENLCVTASLRSHKLINHNKILIGQIIFWQIRNECHAESEMTAAKFLPAAR